MNRIKTGVQVRRDQLIKNYQDHILKHLVEEEEEDLIQIPLKHHVV
jgi:hypothetical protein